MTPAQPHGVFVGLTTLDLIYSIDGPLLPDQKKRAEHALVVAGGPAANAAVTFVALGGRATLVTCIGAGPLAAAALDDLDRAGVTVVDAADDKGRIPVSSILVQRDTGERAVVSLNDGAVRPGRGVDLADLDVSGSLDDLGVSSLDGVDVVLADGHHPALAAPLLRAARARGVPTIFDGGSWKPTSADLLAHVDIAVCSADFRVPPAMIAADHRDNARPPSTLDAVASLGPEHVAITRGPEPIRWRSPTSGGSIPVPAVDVVDTLGAGDVFHGAFAHRLVSIAADAPFVDALRYAAAVAAHSCRHFGTRAWIDDLPDGIR